MNLNKFQELSKRTMPYNGEPANQAEFENMLGNYAMGLVGEAVEVLEAKASVNGDIKKELGDVSHYAVGIALLAKFELNFRLKLMNTPLTFIINDLVIASKNISEVAKKNIYHRHEDKFMVDDLITIFNCLYTLGEYYADSYEDVLQTNIDKLKERYPENFNTAASIERVDVASNK